jgi:hypothetical protein
MGSEPQPRELGRVHLGSGEYRIVHWPAFGPLEHPALMLVSEEGSGGGGQCSEQLRWVLGHSYMGTASRTSGSFLVHGEVAAGHRRVSLVCWNGAEAPTTLLDCTDALGLNVYVAEVLSQPLRIVASNDKGHWASMLMGQPSFWTHETPEEAALSGWPTASQARVRSVVVQGDRAEVVVDADPRWTSWVYCVRTRGRWHEAIAESGPTVEWDDPWPDPLTPPADIN